MAWIDNILLLLLTTELRYAKGDLENFEWQPTSVTSISKPHKDRKVQDHKHFSESSNDYQRSLEPMQNNNYLIESSIAKVSAAKSKSVDNYSTIHPDTYYGDDLSLVFVTPVPRRRKPPQSPTTISTTSTTESSVESSINFPSTELPQTLQAIFQAEPNDYDFIPSLSFNEIPSVETPPPSTFLKTDFIKDKTLEELFALAYAKDAFKATDLGGSQDASQSSRKPEVILPSDDIFTPPFKFGSSKNFLGKP